MKAMALLYSAVDSIKTGQASDAEEKLCRCGASQPAGQADAK